MQNSFYSAAALRNRTIIAMANSNSDSESLSQELATYELSGGVLTILLIGDFFGLVFIFFAIFWLIDNISNWKEGAHKVDHYIR